MFGRIALKCKDVKYHINTLILKTVQISYEIAIHPLEFSFNNSLTPFERWQKFMLHKFKKVFQFLFYVLGDNYHSLKSFPFVLQLPAVEMCLLPHQHKDTLGFAI